MVKYETIIKIIEANISQSHLHLKIPSPVKKTLNQCRKETRGKKTEFGRIITDQGNIIIRRKGGKKEVDWGDKLHEGYVKNGEKPYHVTHNHPNPMESSFPTCLSEGDLYGLFNYHGLGTGLFMKSLTADDSHNNSRMTLVLGDSWHKKPVNEWDDKMNTKLQKANQLSKEMVKEWKESYRRYNETKYNYLKENWDTDSIPYTDEEYEKYYNLQRVSFNKAMRESGYFQSLKKFQKEFREIDCRLTVEDMDDDLGKEKHPKTYVNLLKA